MSTSRTRVVVPVTATELGDERSISALGDGGRTVDRVQIVRGPASIESEYEAALAAPDTLRLMAEAETEGVDAAVIDCMGDPALQAARELVSMPVLGPAQTGMHLACLLGHRFSVATIGEQAIPELENLARVYGVSEQLASVRSVDIPVLELADDPDRLAEALVEASAAAVLEDGAHVILFGCTGMAGYAKRVRDGLAAHGIEGVPVIDPMPAAVRIAQALAELGLTHSKRTYPHPPAKDIPGFDYVTEAGQSARQPVTETAP